MMVRSDSGQHLTSKCGFEQDVALCYVRKELCRGLRFFNNSVLLKKKSREEVSCCLVILRRKNLKKQEVTAKNVMIAFSFYFTLAALSLATIYDDCL